MNPEERRFPAASISRSGYREKAVMLYRFHSTDLLVGLALTTFLRFP